MKLPGLLAIGAFLLVGHSGASAQLVDEQVVGSEKVCTYRAGPVGDQVRSRRVGIGEVCAAYYPTIDRNLQPPPTARLSSSSVADGLRFCIYEQRGRTWSFSVPITAQCSLTAGMLEAERSRVASE